MTSIFPPCLWSSSEKIWWIDITIFLINSSEKLWFSLNGLLTYFVLCTTRLPYIVLDDIILHGSRCKDSDHYKLETWLQRFQINELWVVPCLIYLIYIYLLHICNTVMAHISPVAHSFQISCSLSKVKYYTWTFLRTSRSPEDPHVHENLTKLLQFSLVN